MPLISKNPDDYYLPHERKGEPSRGSSGGGRMMRAHRLLTVTWRLVSSDRRLLLFPALSTAGGTALGAIAWFSTSPLEHGRTSFLIAAIIVSAPLTLLTIGCGVGTASLVSDVLDGREPSIARARALIRKRAGVIVAWSVFMWAIGAALKALEERLPFGGRIVAFALEIGFTFMTMLAVPVLAFEGLSPRGTLNRSASLMRSSFAELLVGTIAIGCASIILTAPGIALLIAGMVVIGSGMSPVLFGMGMTWVVAVVSLSASLDFAFRTVLYRVAIGESVERSGLSNDELNLGFFAK